ncbi:MAG: sugar phosphate isomerase/epimerase family protein [Blastocatellia bacterium]
MKLAFPVATPDTADETMLALRGDLGESFRLLARLGYDGAELMVRDPRRLNPDEIRTLAARHNLALPAVSTGQLRKEDGLQLCTLDESARSRAVARTKEVIEFAAAINSPQINIGTLRGHLPAPAAERDQALAAARASVNELLNYAAERGVGVALEPQSRFVSNWLNSVDEAMAWLRPFAQPNWSLLFDAYHALFEEASVYAALIRARPKISHVQVADSNRLAPGGGQVNFGELLRVLAALDYRGHVSVEVLPLPSAAETAARAARCLRPLLEELS